MFSELLILSLAVVLVCVAVLSGLAYTNLRDNLIQARMDALKTQAKDVSYLASRMSFDSLSGPSEQPSMAKEYLIEKSNRIYEDYKAFVIVVERTMKFHFYYNQSFLQDELMAAMPSKEELSKYIELALQGQEDVEETHNESGSMFSVMVPWEQYNQLTRQRTVMGYVLVRTAAQTVHAVYQDLIWQTALAAVAMFLLAAAVVFFVAQQMTRPLTAMAQAAERMSQGDFTARAPDEGGKEIQGLARSFNRMASQLSSLEQNRREFVANVSHELRSPITSIKGFAQGMLDGTIPQEMHNRYLQVVFDETQRLAKLINNLLNLSRMENEETSLAFSHFDLNEMTRRVLISRMTQIDDKNMEIEVDFESENCYVHADADQIQQVIINLLDNAIKYTPSHGTVTLSTKTENDHVVMRVKDNGVGIPEEDAPYIFDRFYKVDKAHTVGKGTGLGLAICKRIMDRHSQQLRLVSGTGGAVFEFTLEKGNAPGGTYDHSGARQD